MGPTEYGLTAVWFSLSFCVFSIIELYQEVTIRRVSKGHGNLTCDVLKLPGLHSTLPASASSDRSPVFDRRPLDMCS